MLSYYILVDKILLIKTCHMKSQNTPFLKQNRPYMKYGPELDKLLLYDFMHGCYADCIRQAVGVQLIVKYVYYHFYCIG